MGRRLGKLQPAGILGRICIAHFSQKGYLDRSSTDVAPGSLGLSRTRLRIQEEAIASSVLRLEKHPAELVHLDVVTAVQVVASEKSAHQVIPPMEVQDGAKVHELRAVQLATVIPVQPVEKVVEGKQRVVLVPCCGLPSKIKLM